MESTNVLDATDVQSKICSTTVVRLDNGYGQKPCHVLGDRFYDNQGSYIMLKSAKFIVPTITLKENQRITVYIDDEKLGKTIRAGWYTFSELLSVIEVIEIVYDYDNKFLPDDNRRTDLLVDENNLVDFQSGKDCITINVIHTVDLGPHLSKLLKCDQILYPGYHYITKNILITADIWSCFAVVRNKRTYLRSFPVYSKTETCLFDSDIDAPYWKQRPCKIYLPDNVSNFDIVINRSDTTDVYCSMKLEFLTAQ